MLSARGNLLGSLYAIMATNDDELEEKLKKEKQEDDELERR